MIGEIIKDKINNVLRLKGFALNEDVVVMYSASSISIKGTNSFAQVNGETTSEYITNRLINDPKWSCFIKEIEQ